MDCFTAANMDSWTNSEVTYMPTDISNKIVGSFADVKKNKASDIYKIQVPKKNTLLIPYMYVGHCSALVIDKQNCTWTLLDPYEQSVDDGRAIKHFYNYVNSCKSDCTLSEFKNIHLEEKIIDDRPF